MTTIKNQIALVTGANRGIGKEFVQQLLDRGAAKVYATARNPEQIDSSDPRVVALALDVTDTAAVERIAAQVPDLTILINNAGIAASVSPVSGDLDEMRREMETNLYGPINTMRALAPIIVGNGGGAILNVHSVLSWIARAGSYSVSKSAIWAATNAARLELHPKNVQVVGLQVGYVDTDMAAHVDAPKVKAHDVVAQSLDAIESGAFEVNADELTQGVKQGLSADITALYPELAAS